MPDFSTLEPAIDPNNRITFLLDWELTMKCNLDCSYCDSSTYGGHNNSIPHPPLADCLNTIDFMFEYVDQYMQRRRPAFRHVVLNVYGGESLHHPDIVEILTQVHQRYKQYQYQWSLRVTCTTNAIVTSRKLQQIIPLIDEFTVSYHTEARPRDKAVFLNNILQIKNAGVDIKCVVLMHPEPELFADAQQMIQWLTDNGVRHLPRQLDHSTSDTQFNYETKQVTWFKKLYSDKSFQPQQVEPVAVLDDQGRTDLASTGRACCGGRQLCLNSNFKSREFFVDNHFTDWYCSVDQFFLYIKQVNGEIFVNKDCKMNYQGEVGPIGNLNNTPKLLSELAHNLNTTAPVIQCKKSRCYCGLCAPKAQTLEQYYQTIKKYQT